jgi:hypothetical protein
MVKLGRPTWSVTLERWNDEAGEDDHHFGMMKAVSGYGAGIHPREYDLRDP